MKNIFFITLLALVGSFFGCSTVNTVERVTPEAKAQMVNDKRIITDSALNDYAYVASVNQAYVGGLLKIQARLVNSTAATRKIRYKFSWFDENAMEINSTTSNWQVLELEGGEARNISAVATNKSVKDFSLKLLPEER